MPSSQTPSLQSLFASAVDDGMLSAGTASMLSGHLGPIVLAGAAGTSADQIAAAEVLLFTVLLDGSSSIAQRRLTGAVCDGYGTLLDALVGSREADSVLVALWTFNQSARVVHSYVPVRDATRLDVGSWRPQGMTNLYDAWCDALAANVAYAAQLRASGTPCRSVVVVLTDGEDTGSRRRPADCARLAKDLLASEQFVLAFVGVGKDSDFRQVAADMGVPDGSVAVKDDATPAALRSVFQLVSRSAIRASQGRIQTGPQAGFFL